MLLAAVVLIKGRVKTIFLCINTGVRHFPLWHLYSHTAQKVILVLGGDMGHDVALYWEL